MAEDDQDRARKEEAEREAQIHEEMEAIGQDPDQVQAGRDNLGTQNAPSGTRHEEEGELEETQAATDETDEAADDEP